MLKVFGGAKHTKFKNSNDWGYWEPFPAKWDKAQIKPMNFEQPEKYFTPSEIEENRTLVVSYICCGYHIDSEEYSMFLFEGSESEYFVLGGEKLWFQSLLSELSDSKRGSMMKRVVSNNGKFILFEMMDGSLYEFNVKSLKMNKFFISHSSRINCIGSGINSSCWLVQTIDGIVYEKQNNDEPSEIEFPFTGFKVKQFEQFSDSSAQFILLEDNRLFIRKNGFGFENLTGELRELNLISSISSPIKKISVGYSHIILLLEDAKVFCKGTAITGSRILKEFQRVIVTGYVVDVYCSWKMTVVRNETHFIMFSKSGTKIEIENENETLVFGNNSGFIYQRTFFKNSDDSIPFLSQLLSQLTNPALSDIVFHFE